MMVAAGSNVDSHSRLLALVASDANAMDRALQQINPLRSPRWRCDLVLKWLPHAFISRSIGDEHSVRLYHRFLRLGASANKDRRPFAELCKRYPEMLIAHKLYYSPCPEQRHILEARLLTSETYAEVAQRMGTCEKVVSHYAELFFDVRDRFQATAWIMQVILGPSRLRSTFRENGELTQEQRAFLYRFFGYFGGPLVLDALIAGIGEIKMPERPDEVDKWLDSTVLQIVRTRAAAAAHLFEVNRGNAIRLLKLALPRNNKRTNANTMSDEELSSRLARVYADLGFTNGCT
jgi:hypothetical protein